MRSGSTLAVCLLLGLASCRSGGPKEVSPETKLSIYRETALAHYQLARDGTGDDRAELLRAESQAVKGLGIDKKDEQLRLLYGWIQIEKGSTADLMRAEKVFAELAGSKDTRALLGLATAKERLGVVYEQSADAIESGETYTQHKDPAERVAELHADARRSWSEAETGYRAVLAERPKSVKALNGMQRVEALRGNYLASLEWSDRLLAAAGEELSGWEDQLRLGDLNIEQESRLRDMHRDTRELWVSTQLFAAETCRELGRDSAALEHLDSALAADPKRTEAYGRRGQILKDLGRPEEARRAVQDYLRQAGLEYDHPDVRRAYELLAECDRMIAANGR
jgi:tetratricopeptide (TPR) repeat protein